MSLFMGRNRKTNSLYRYRIDIQNRFKEDKMSGQPECESDRVVYSSRMFRNRKEGKIMSINTHEVYVTCPACGAVTTEYDYHENTSSERVELLCFLNTGKPSNHLWAGNPADASRFICPSCKHETPYRTIFTPRYCKVQDVSSGLLYLGKRAFAHTWISRFFFPQTIQAIGEECFMDCADLNHLWIPAGVEVGRNAFANCPSLKQIQISECILQDSVDTWGLSPDCVIERYQ